MERIQDSLSKQIPYNTAMETPKSKTQTSNYRGSSFDDFNNTVVGSPKEFKSPLHFKTHFKAVETMTMKDASKSLKAPTRDQAKIIVSSAKQQKRRTTADSNFSAQHSPVKTIMLPASECDQMAARLKVLPAHTNGSMLPVHNTKSA